MSRKWILLVLILAILVCSVPSASAQKKYPDQPIDLIIGFGVGGGADVPTRILQPTLEKVLGVSTPVTNISGASGDVGLGKVLSRRADGYAVGYQNSNSTTNMALGTSPYKYDDFIYLCRIHTSTFWLFVNAEDTRFKTWKDLVAAAKANPGKLSIAVEGLGGQDELIVRFLAEHGINLKIVPYGNPQQRYTTVVGKHDDILIEQVGDVVGFIENKQMRPLIVFDQKRDKLFPDIPCSFEEGLKLDTMQYRSYVLKKGTPPERVKMLGEAFRQAYLSDAYQKALKSWSVDPETAWLGPEKFGDYVKNFVEEISVLTKKYGMGKK